MTAPWPNALKIEPQDKEEFHTLTLRLKNQDTQLVGRLHLIRLERLRSFLGERWDHLSERIHATFHSYLQNRALNNFVFYPYDEDSYFMFTYQGSTKSAQLRAENISHEILARLLGEEAPLDLVEVYTWARGSDDLPSFQALPAPPDVPLTELSQRLEYVYRPLFSPRKGVIQTFVCMPTLSLGSIGYCTGYDVLDNPDDAQATAMLDLQTLQHVAGETSNLESLKDECEVIIPVHFNTLRHPDYGAAYIQACRNLIGERKDTLGFEVVGLPDHLAEHNFAPLIGELHEFSVYVIARADVDSTVFIDLRIAGLEAVSVDLYNDFRSEAQLLEALERFTITANEEGLDTCVYGIRTLSMNTAAIGAGASYIGGYPISKTLRTINGRSQLDMLDLYTNSFDAA